MKSLFAFALAAAAAMSAAQSTPPGHQLKVMTQNLYFGTDLGPVLAAQDLPSFIAAVTSRFAQVVHNDFPARAELIADEIALEQPDILALQECVTWYRGAYTGAPTEDVAYDYLAILEDELAERGLDYRVAAIENGFDVHGPGIFGGVMMDVRLADHEVVLIRNRTGLSFRNGVGANFANYLIAPSLGGPQHIKRGYCSVDVVFRGKPFRFISTHLEPDVPYYSNLQSGEILSGPANTSMDVIYAGDLNSNADGSGPFHAYAISLAGGFMDAWLTCNPSDPGYTIGHDANLMDPPNFTRRIDYVLYRGAKVVPISASLFGLDPNLTTPSGLYPSDHAGLIATLVIK